MKFVKIKIKAEIKADMSAFFSKDTQKEEARRLLRETKFVIGDDPLLYVTKRTRFLMLAEPHLDEKDKVNRLIEGLPEDIRLSLMYARSDTVQMFTDNLRDLMNHSYLGKRLARRADRPTGKPNVQYFNKMQSFPTGEPSQQKNEHRGKMFRTPDNKPICYQCGGYNHVAKYCRTNPPPNPPMYGPNAAKPYAQQKEELEKKYSSSGN